MRKLVYLALVFIFCSTSLLAQSFVEKAKAQSGIGEYDAAIENYKLHLDANPNDKLVLSELAEVYFRTNNYIDAVSCMERLASVGDLSPDQHLLYGHLLKATGSYNQATRQYQLYANTNINDGAHYAASCSEAKQLLLLPSQYTLSLFPNNSDGADFGLHSSQEALYFSSNQTGNLALYRSLSNGTAVEPLTEQITFTNATSNIHGPITSFANQVAYTKAAFWNSNKPVVGDETDMNIAFAEFTDAGTLQATVDFDYNTVGYASAFPCFANNGNTMIFSSNRPGGNGQFDLYISNKKNGNWSEPKNLGSTINTPGNEITPYISNNTLYFSSDYHFGIGGFDVFKANISSDGTVGDIVNLGKGINSSSDDFYFVQDMNTNLAYFSSNRIGGTGTVDIYMAEPINPLLSVVATSEEFVPQAVELASIANLPKPSKDILVNSEVTTEQAMTKTVSMNEADNKDLALGTNNYFSLEGAQFVSMIQTAELGEPVYFIQLASLSRNTSNMNRYSSLNEYANVYKVYKGNTIKVRLGYFNDRAQASRTLTKVRSRGFKDAFIVNDNLNSASLELVSSSNNSTNYDTTNSASTVVQSPTYTPSGTRGNFKVRLASYTDPLWFDASSVKDIGEIEQWTKGSFTIFILSGYSTFDEANRALIKAVNRGYSDAHLVEDRNGFLEKVESR